jgi:anti-anti-sigma regulatory factor
MWRGAEARADAPWQRDRTMSEHNCEVLGNRLVITGDFSKDADTCFDAACQKLLAAGEKDLVADLTGATRLCSTYVGLLAELCLDAKGRGKKLVIRSGPKISKVLKEAGLASAAELEEIG